VAEGITCCNSLLRVTNKHALEEGYRQDIHSIIHLPLETEFHFLVLAVDLLILSALEQRSPGEEDVEDSPYWEDIALGFDVFVLGEGDYFRCDVAWSSTPKEEILLDISMGCQSVVHDNWGHRWGVPKHYIFWFEVSVHDPVAVHVLESTEQSKHELLDLLLRKISIPLLYAMK
jgi:hypothetical protein